MTSQVHCVTSISGDWMCDISKMIRIDTFVHNIGTVWSIDPLQLVSGLPGSSVFVLRRVISHIFKKVSYHLFCSLSGWEENSPTCLAGFSPRRCMSLNLKCRSQSFNRLAPPALWVHTGPAVWPWRNICIGHFYRNDSVELPYTVFSFLLTFITWPVFHNEMWMWNLRK